MEYLSSCLFKKLYLAYLKAIFNYFLSTSKGVIVYHSAYTRCCCRTVIKAANRELSSLFAQREQQQQGHWQQLVLLPAREISRPS